MGTGAQSINTSLDILNSWFNYRAQKENRDANLAMGLLRLQTARINREEDNINRQREIKAAQFNSMRDELSKVMTLNDNINNIDEENQSDDSNKLLANIHNKQLRNMSIAREEIKGYDKQIQSLRLERAKYDEIRNKVIAEYDTKAEDKLKLDTLTAVQLEKFAGVEDLDNFYKDVTGDASGKYKKGIYALSEALKKEKFSKTKDMYDRRKREERDWYDRNKDKGSKGGIGLLEYELQLREPLEELKPEVEDLNKFLKNSDLKDKFHTLSVTSEASKTLGSIKGSLNTLGVNIMEVLNSENMIEDSGIKWSDYGMDEAVKDFKKAKDYQGKVNASASFMRGLLSNPELIQKLDIEDMGFYTHKVDSDRRELLNRMVNVASKYQKVYDVERANKTKIESINKRIIGGEFKTREEVLNALSNYRSPIADASDNAYTQITTKDEEPVSAEQGIGNRLLSAGKEFITGGSVVDIIGAVFKKEEKEGREVSDEEFINIVKKEPEQTTIAKFLNPDKTTQNTRLKVAKTELEKTKKDLTSVINGTSSKGSGVLASVLFGDQDITNKSELKKKLAKVNSKLKLVNEEIRINEIPDTVADWKTEIKHIENLISYEEHIKNLISYEEGGLTAASKRQTEQRIKKYKKKIAIIQSKINKATNWLNMVQ